VKIIEITFTILTTSPFRRTTTYEGGAPMAIWGTPTHPLLNFRRGANRRGGIFNIKGYFSIIKMEFADV